MFELLRIKVNFNFFIGLFSTLGLGMNEDHCYLFINFGLAIDILCPHANDQRLHLGTSNWDCKFYANITLLFTTGLS